MGSLPRRVAVFAKDRYGRPIPEVNFSWQINGNDAGSINNSSQSNIDIADKEATFSITAVYKGKKKTVTLDNSQTSYTFYFGVSVFPYWRDFFMKHFPAVVGIVFILIAVTLAFVFPEPNNLQRHLILAMFSLGGGGFGGEIAGFIKVDMTLKNKLEIAAGGAAAIFVLLFFFVPAGAA